MITLAFRQDTALMIVKCINGCVTILKERI